MARIGRRSAALIVDWFIAWLISQPFSEFNSTGLITLLVFALIQVLFIPTIGGSIGHRIFGMRVVSISGGWVGFLKPIIRTLLLVLVLPVLVWDSDQRGFHDKIPGTVLIRS